MTPRIEKAVEDWIGTEREILKTSKEYFKLCDQFSGENKPPEVQTKLDNMLDELKKHVTRKYAITEYLKNAIVEEAAVKEGLKNDSRN